jgi:oxygen-independent coproporphyrinogen-3 oxidase
VPFCARRCRYCDFVVTTAAGKEAHRRFLDAVSLESGFHGPSWSGRAFETLYFGGGTPSRLSASEFTALMSVLRREFRFTPSPEITIEANPDDVEPERLSAWRAAGVTRVSLGAQSFRDRTLAHANRSHDAAQIVEAVRRLRGGGFQAVNLDLILSMPGESLADVLYSVECLLGLAPEHVSLYELVVEPRTVYAKWKADGKLSCAREEEQTQMLVEARGLLARAGYRHYELLNFAKPGFESRHNLLYWANRDYLGLGPGACSYRDGRRWRFAAGVEEYYRKIEARQWTPGEEESLSSERREVESFLLSLRIDEGAPAERFAGVFEKKTAEIGRLVERGLLQRDARGVRLSERGKLFAETVFSELC